jgi:exonuclease SbcC
MISSIAIKWFETHQDTLIELHSGCNVIIGESDEGKSSIVRAIKWNTQNRPQGDSYRNDELDPKDKEDKQKITEVKIDYQNSGIVTRARDGFSSGVNHYQIDDQEPLRALRSDVPDEVLSISKIKDVNIQGQHPSEQYFLIGDSAGSVAKEFNKVAGLVIMDKALSDINSQVRSCNSQIKTAKLEIDEKLGELEETKWVELAEKLANKLEGFKIRITKKREEYNVLHDYLYDLQEIEISIDENFKDLDLSFLAVKNLKEQYQSIADKKSDINTLSELILSANNIDSMLNASTDIQDASKALKSLNLLSVKILDYQNEIFLIKSLFEKIKSNDSDLFYIEEEFLNIKKQYDKIWKEQSCPVCGRKGK